MEKCERCDGAGHLQGFACPGFRPIELPCWSCNGKGQVDDNTRLWKEIGEMIRTCRLARDKSQREFAEWIGTDVVALSKAEGGRVDPKAVNELLRAKIDADMRRITGRTAL